MPKKRKKLKSGTNANAKPKSMVSLAKTPFNGDHGPSTEAANFDTEIVEIEGPNRMAYRKRKDRVHDLKKMPQITLRQIQAAEEIQDAWCECEALSSGGPLKEQVDASPKPDATVAAQVDAQSRLHRATRRLLSVQRPLVYDVCCHNLQWEQIIHRHGALTVRRLQAALDRAADGLGY